MPYMRPSEFAVEICVTPVEVEGLLQEGLPSIKGPKGIRLIDVDIGLAWIRENTDLLEAEDEEDEGDESAEDSQATPEDDDPNEEGSEGTSSSDEDVD